MRQLNACLWLLLTAAWDVDAQCHAEGDKEYCLKGYTTSATRDCHYVGSEYVCFGQSGPTSTLATSIATLSISPSAQFTKAPTTSKSESKSASATSKPKDAQADENREQPESGKKKHGHGREKAHDPATCRPDADEEYSLKLRIAAIFIVFTTSSLGVLSPIFLRQWTKLQRHGVVFTFIKQFGTGVIISTVFIHLLTHAVMQFNNPCVGELEYEGTVMSIAMTGAFISFLVDYGGIQYLRRKHEHHGQHLTDQPDPFMSGQASDKKAGRTLPIESVETAETSSLRQRERDEAKLSVFIMEGGIIFHSILIGVLLAVTPDDEFPILFAVILIHQTFEGIALGARIEFLEGVGEKMKIVMGLLFSATSPTGMAIGIGVRKSFNGMNRNTIVTLGTMDALSAGVLAWVAFVELWSKDWLYRDMRAASGWKAVAGMGGLVVGLAVMSLLGKWA